MLRSHLQFMRFVVSGGAGFSVEIAVFAAMLSVQDSLAIANGLAVGTASALNYTLHVVWVFRTTARPRTTMTRYVLSLIVSYMLSTSCVLLVVALGVPEVAAKVLVSLALAPLAFLAGRYWVYPGGIAFTPLPFPPR